VAEPTDLKEVAERMRRDWNERALQDAERFVYTRSSDPDVPDFSSSGRANYDQLVRPYLPVLLNGAAARDCRVLEIGCGVGRMTRWFAQSFGEVHGIDIAPDMIGQARDRLAAYPNVALHTGSGFDLQSLPDACFDLVFSYIVFQHIPSAAVIGNYVREAARVLKPLGAFKFQVNGDQSAAYRAHVRDTWQGETFSRDEVHEMLEVAGLSVATVEDAGTQYFVVTARKGLGPDRRTYYLPGEPEDGGWRPVAPQSTIRLLSPGGEGARLYAGIYFWPKDPHEEHCVTMIVDGTALGARVARGPGDHFLEWTPPPHASGFHEIRMEIAPPCAQPHWPALRIVGIAPAAGAQLSRVLSDA
jgi:ubiquinone/menaquinone biosynthesis C-methylase UbiE